MSPYPKSSWIAEGFPLALRPLAVAVDECYAQGIDRNSRYESREKEPGETNPNRCWVLRSNKLASPFGSETAPTMSGKR